MYPKEPYNRTITRIEEEVSRGRLGVHELAEQVARMNALGVREMSAVMRCLTFETLEEYIRKRRMMRAFRYLIEDPEAEVSQAAELAGMDDVSSFAECFRNEFDMSPEEAMKRKDRSRLKAPLDWDALPESVREIITFQTTRPELEGRAFFGIPRNAYLMALKASELEDGTICSRSSGGSHTGLHCGTWRMWSRRETRNRWLRKEKMTSALWRLCRNTFWSAGNTCVS